jgi:hypothetical protein
MNCMLPTLFVQLAVAFFLTFVRYLLMIHALELSWDQSEIQEFLLA